MVYFNCSKKLINNKNVSKRIESREAENRFEVRNKAAKYDFSYFN